MPYDTVITVRVNRDTKIKAQEYLDSLGLSLSSAINLFLNDIAQNQRFPFDFVPTQLVYVPDDQIPQDVMDSLKELQEEDPSTWTRYSSKID